MYKIMRFILEVYFVVFHRVKYFGRENLPKDGEPCIIVSNHLNKMDILIAGYLYKKRIYFLSKKEWYENKLRAKIFKEMGGIPIDREGIDLEAVKTTLKHLKNNDVIVIYPEGTRNKTGTVELQEIKEGTGMFAFKAKVKIVPIIMHHKTKMFQKNYVNIGKPFDFSEYYDQKYNSDLSKVLTNIIRDKMLECQKELNSIVDNK